MIKFLNGQSNITLRLLATMVVMAVLSACTKDDDTDYCKNHYVYHYEHKDQLTTLNLDVAESGLVTAVITIKGDLAVAYETDSGLQQTLLDSANIYQIDSAGECTDAVVTQSNDLGSPVLTFKSQCTAGAKINQVDIALFNTISALDEIEATIQTSATRKHFAISRQCEGAIYRLAKKQDKS